MKTRFSLLLLAVVVCQWVAAQVHISVSDPETWSAEALRPYINQEVIFDAPIVVCSNTGSALTVSTRRLFTPSNQALPKTSEYNSVVSLNNKGAIDLSNVPYRPSDNPYRCGEKIYNLRAKVITTNNLSYISGDWLGNTRADLEKGIPDLGDYRLLVCGFNLEYYLAVQFDPSSSMGPDNAEEHERQKQKIGKALKLINADIYGFVEIQQGPDALNELAAYLNDMFPSRRYTPIHDGTTVKGTYTKSAILYDANKVKTASVLQSTDEGVVNRKKMICFEELATGERFIFSINHFKAKSGSGSGDDADQKDGQGTFNGTRTREANAVIDLYKRLRSSSIREKDVLIMGDLNAYAKEDPITTFRNNGMIDLHRAFHADSSYSYQFNGLAGYLDHALCNGTLYPQVTGVSGFHINSDENDRYTYDKSNDNTMFRCSDHDPVLVGLKLDKTLQFDPSPTVNSIEVLVGEVNVMTITNAYIAGKKSHYALYSISGREVDHGEITQDDQEVPLPSASGVYIVYIYSDGQVYQRKLIVR